MKRLSTLLAVLLCAVAATFADLPFRNHRYDSFKVLPVTSDNIVFIGNSITDMHCWPEAFVTSTGEYLPIVNRGNSGTYSTEQSDNLESYIYGKPKKVFMMIGTNDIATSGGLNASPEQVLSYIKSIVTRIHARSSETKVYLYSILKNNTSNRVEATWLKANELIKAYAEATDKVTYVDLYDKLAGIAGGGAWSYDYLHLTAGAYQAWCETICEHLAEDEDYTVKAVYPEETLTLQNRGGLTNAAHGMRATYFSCLPIKSTDVLVFGDAFVKNGEWQELLGNRNVKNRGTGWNNSGDIATTSGIVDATFATIEGVTKTAPKAIFLYTGTSDCTGSTDIATVKANYKALVDKIAANAATSKIYLMAICPRNTASHNTRIAELNTYMKSLATDGSNIRFVDTYSPMLTDDAVNSKYVFSNDYIGGLAYVKMANLMKTALLTDFPNDTYTVSTDEEAEARYTQAGLRNQLTQVITRGLLVSRGDGVGQYTEADCDALDAKLSEAYTMLEGTFTEENITTFSNELTTTINSLLPEINMPTYSTENSEVWYQLNTPNRGSKYLSNFEAGAGVTGEAANNYPSSMWKFVLREDGTTLDIINRKTNAYLSPTANYDSQIMTVATQPEKGWTLSYANTAGLFIVSSGTVQLNQTQSTAVYNWSSGQTGTDRDDTGCQYMISLVEGEADEEPTVPTDENFKNVVLTLNALTDGWYKMRLVTGSDATAQGYVTNGTNHVLNANAPYCQSASNYYPLKYGAYDADQPATGWVKIKKIDSKYLIQSISGFALAENCTAVRSLTTANNTLSMTYGGFTTVDKWSYYNPGTNTEQPYIGKSSSSSHKFAFAPVTATELAAYDIYTVTIDAENASEIGSDASITYNGEAAIGGIATVYNNGYMFFPAGTTPAAEDFTLPEGLVMTVDASAKTLTVAEPQEETEETIAYTYNLSDGGAYAGSGWCTSWTSSNAEKPAFKLSVSAKNMNGASTSTEGIAVRPGTAGSATYTITSGCVIYNCSFEAKGTDSHKISIGSGDQVAVGSEWKTFTISNVNSNTATFNLHGDNSYDCLIRNIVISTLALPVQAEVEGTWDNNPNTHFGNLRTTDGDNETQNQLNMSHLTMSLIPYTGGNPVIDFTRDYRGFEFQGYYVGTTALGKSFTLTDELKETITEENPIIAKFKATNDVTLFYDDDEKSYRIPAIATTSTGRIIAVSDYRHNLDDIGRDKHGTGTMRIDLVARTSDDNGKTWSETKTIAAGNNDLTGQYGRAFGDAAIAAVGQNIVVMAAAGDVMYPYASAENPNRMARIFSSDNGKTWSVKEMTTKLYSTSTSLIPSAVAAFFGSGKLAVDPDYNNSGNARIYGALLIKNATSNYNNFAVYSDDLGETWSILGGDNENPIAGGDEPKVEILPNGQILLSVRRQGGRIFRVFTYTDKATDTGSWGDAAVNGCNNGGSNGTNGEIFLAEGKKQDGTAVKLLLQSQPKGGSGQYDRRDVTIWYKEVDAETTYTSSTIAADWTEGLQVSTQLSSYSTMSLQEDDKIAFFFEEAPCYGDDYTKGYSMAYVPLTIESITKGNYYSLSTDLDAAATINVVLTDAQGNTYTDQLTECKVSEVATKLTEKYTYITLGDDIALNYDGEAYTYYNSVELPFKVSNSENTIWHNIYWPSNDNSVGYPVYMSADASSDVVKISTEKLHYGNSSFNTLNNADKISWAFYQDGNGFTFKLKNKLNGKYVMTTDNPVSGASSNTTYTEDISNATVFSITDGRSNSYRGEYGLTYNTGQLIVYSVNNGYVSYSTATGHHGGWVKFVEAPDFEALITEINSDLALLGDAVGQYSVAEADQATLETAKTAMESASTVKLNDLLTYAALRDNATLNMPAAGNYYRIKGYVSGNYIDAVNCYSGDQMGMKSATECDNKGTIFYLDEGNRLLNLGTNTYVYATRHIGKTSASDANTWTFAASTRTAGCFTLTASGGSSGSSTQLHDSDGNRADRCSGICGERHDFVLEEVETISLTVEGDSKTGATATWNGETKTLPAVWTFLEGETIEITAPTLTINGNANYKLTSVVEGETAIEGNTIEIATLTADRTFTATFSPAFFSTSTAEADLVPVHIYNVRNNNYTICLNKATDYTNHDVNSGTTDYALNEVWYLVGTTESFKMYSYTAGMNLALTLAGTGSGSAATMTATGTELCLAETSTGYAICPKANTGQSFNMHGGAGNDIKLYGSSDGGSIWGINIIDVNSPLTLSVEVTGEQPYTTNYRVAEMAFAIDGTTTSSRIMGDVEAQKYYLPAGTTFTLSNSYVYRGYTFDGFKDAEGNAAEYTDATVPTGGLTLTASYSVDETNKYQYLYYSNDPVMNKPYRIPAIAVTRKGTILAVTDHRPGGSDVGFAPVDIKIRRSDDNGATWTDEEFIADGTGQHVTEGDVTYTNVFDYAFGDAAIVADRESDEVLVMCVGGKQNFPGGDATHHNYTARLRSHDGGVTWDAPENVTANFMDVTPLYNKENPNGYTPILPEAYTLFYGSGRILQSRVFKAEGSEYYRIYAALLVREVREGDSSASHNNYVVYSDNFGETWNLLGDRCVLGGDEAKVEELPDGTIVISSRKAYGRYFNVFTFTDIAKAEGAWSTAVASENQTGGISYGSNACNGEIFKVKAIRNSDGTICDVMLQSLPTGQRGDYTADGRNDVTIFYKEMEYNEDGTNKYTPTTFAENWSTGMVVSEVRSAYSTMALQANGDIAFLYEEDPESYCIVYVPLSLEEITNGDYSLYTVVESSISEHKIGTFYANTAMTIPTGVKAYVATTAPDMEKGVITMTEITDGIIPAETGVVLRGEANTYLFTPANAAGTAVTNNLLQGYAGTAEYEEVALPTDGSTNYVLAVENGQTGFYKKEDDFKVYNHKAYLNVPATQGVRSFAIRFDGDGSTGIENSKLEIENSAVVYDLQGRRVVNPAKGVYIVNGKKVVIR